MTYIKKNDRNNYLYDVVNGAVHWTDNKKAALWFSDKKEAKEFAKTWIPNRTDYHILDNTIW